MPADGRWDLDRRAKVKLLFLPNYIITMFTQSFYCGFTLETNKHLPAVKWHFTNVWMNK